MSLNLKDLDLKNLKDKRLEELIIIKKQVSIFLLQSRFDKVFSSLKEEKSILTAKKTIARIETLIRLLQK